jgi:arsenate reductase
MHGTKILFVCSHNSARSQMAEAFFNHLYTGEITAESAGIEPGSLNPYAVTVMKEIGIDISQNSTNNVFEYYKEGRLYKYVITVCDEKTAEMCPIFAGVTERLHWSFEDPSALTGDEESILNKTREIRDMIKQKVEEFIKEYFK